VLPQKEQDEPVPVLTASVNLMETLDLVIRKLQMPQGTSRPGSSYIRLGFWKAHSN
jgi:hypothetical protein